MESESIVIVGGGIAGLSTALALHRVGLKSLVLERGNSLRVTGAALNLWTNAWKALDALGIADKLRRDHLLLQGDFRSQVISIEDGLYKETPFRDPGKLNHEVRCVKRRVLLETLADALPPGTIRFSSKVVGVKKTNNNGAFPIALELRDGTIIQVKVLIGCDGVNSIIADWLGIQPAKLLGRSTSRGLSIFPEGHGFEPKLYINLQKGMRVGYIPINDKDVFWFLNRKSLPQDLETAQDPARMLQEALDLLANFPDEYCDIVKKTQMDTLTFMPLRFQWPWAVLLGRLCNGTVTVAGDAMHSMTPYIGQGGCSTLEDAVILGRCLSEAMCGNITSSEEGEGERIEEVLKKYVAERRWRVFMLMTKSYITGLLQPGSGAFVRIIREKIMARLPGNVFGHVEYDCGSLSLTSC